MVYNDHSRELTITGGTFSKYFTPGEVQSESPSGSDCFVAILHLPHESAGNTSTENTNQDEVSWVRRRQFGNSPASEFCSALYVGEKGNMLAVGHSGEGGILAPLLPYGDSRRSVYGMIIDLGDNVELRGGRLLHSNKVQFPVAIVSDPTTEDIFVAEMVSDNDLTDAQLDPASIGQVFGSGIDHSTTGNHSPMYGMTFSVRLQTFKSNSTTSAERQGNGLAESLHPGWSREFGTVGEEDVQVSGLSYVAPSALLMTGYTLGTGPAFGSEGDSSKRTIDGFVTAIDPSTGDVIHAKRIESLLSVGNDRVLGICRPDSSTSSEIYVVGTTDGIFDATYLQSLSINHNHAFLLKLDLNGMEIVWSRQIGGDFPEELKLVTGKGPQVHGLACTVTPDGKDVYMAGDVKDGAMLSIVNETAFASAGSNDIFVAKFRSDDGLLEFARQIGSEGEDSLAQGNSLATDAAGNLILLGNTRGSFYRRKAANGAADVFTMSISRESGAFLPPLDDKDKKDPSDFFNDDRWNHYEDGSQEMNEENWYRYHNALLAIGVLLGTAIVLIGIAMIVRQRRLRLSDEIPYDQYLDELDGNKSTVTMEDSLSGGWTATNSQNGESERSKPKYFFRPSNLFANDPDKVIATPGRPKSSSGYPSEQSDSKGYVTDESGLGPSTNMRRQERGQTEENPYGEVYDLLSLASERLSLDSDIKYEGGNGTRLPRRESDDDISALDDIWNMEVL
jgi:hypothetical protein